MTDLYNNIPDELKALPNWCCWKYEDIGAAKPTKVPYNPITGKHCDVTDKSSWCTFDDCMLALSEYSGLGFVFSNLDSYSGIDLDDPNGDQVTLDRQIKIYREFDSYSEISPSGKGLHIIVKGIVPQGRRRSSIEVYSSGRYFTMTGNVYNRSPIQERQSLLTQLWEQMGAGGPAIHLYKGDDKETQNDSQIIEQASGATNSDKFKALISGEWKDIYQSQSEADFALIDIIAFYTQNRNQIARIFRNSLLGKRDKASRKDYLTWMINKSFDKMLPPLDLDGFKIAIQKATLNERISQHSKPDISNNVNSYNDISPLSDKSSSIRLPPGLLGEIAQFIYQAAPRPVPEIALAAAIGLMAGICGRAYNISGTGLNQYILLLAATGTGKESMALGIDRLMNTIRMQVPTSSRFIGPSEIASGQALIKHLSKSSPCFVSILGEFGLRLESMSSPHANSAEKALKRMLLDLYNKSGYGQVFRPSIFADAEKNIASTDSPSFSILGESTPERFYSALNEDMISEGLLPRFMLMEYNGIRPSLSKTHLQAKPSFELIERFAALVANCEKTMYQKEVTNITSTNDATAILERFDAMADQQINGTSKEVLRQLWNRAHIKALKIAGLIAVGVNPYNPIVTADNVNFAIEMVTEDIKALSAKFEAGEIGVNTHETKQINDLTRVIKDYVTKDYVAASKYVDNERMHYEKIIPYQYISRRLIATAAFRLDKKGATNAIKQSIQVLLDRDMIREIGKKELAEKFGSTQRCFIVSNVKLVL